jgi:hypothetical protein
MLNEEAVEKLSLVQSFADDSANESEHSHHLLLIKYTCLRTWEISTSITTLLKQCIIGIENALRD